MPAPKFTPEQKQELAALYQGGGETIDTLAARYGCDRTCVASNLRKLGVPMRRFSPYTAKALACPYTPERLREMYWKEGLSLSEIGEHARQFFDRQERVFNKTVTRLMQEAGITLRTLSEAQTVDKRRHRARYVEILKAIPGEVKKAKTPPAAFPKAALKAAAEKKKAECWETRPCSLPGCSGTTTRRKSHFRAEFAYCCHAHANSHQAALRREAKLLPVQPTPEIPAWLREIIDQRGEN